MKKPSTRKGVTKKKRAPVAFQGEKSIGLISEDKLNRAGFAKAISTAIQNWKGQDSLVLALYGRWGDGKSSVKAMILDDIKDSSSPPLVVEFNPWEWSGQNQIAEAFFSELGKQIGGPENPKSAQEAGKGLRMFSKAAGFMSQLWATARPVVTVVNPEAAAAMEVGTAAIGLAQHVGKSGAELKEEMFKEKALVEIKSDLKKLFQALDQKILVVLDDIDRLSASEIRLVFQLVKINADFPNVIFLTLFQRDIVEQALEHTVKTGSGRDYLDKIVQIGLDLPKIPSYVMDCFVREKLESALRDFLLYNLFEWNRFNGAFADAFLPYFRNLRDVYRFFDTFRFHLAILSGSAFEANPLDLFAVEILRAFEPDLHCRLAHAKTKIFGSPTQLEIAAIENPDEHRQKWKQALLTSVTIQSKEAVQEILDCLFPHHTSRSGFDQLKTLRISDPDFFDRYFQLELSKGDLAQADFEKVRTSLGNRSAFAASLRRLDKRNLAPATLQRLRAYSGEFRLEDAFSVAAALFDVGDDLNCVSDTTGFELSRTSCWIIDDHLRTADEEKRFRILHEAILATKGIYLSAAQVDSEGHMASKLRPYGNSPLIAVVPEKIPELQRICIQRIKGSVDDTTLLRHPKMEYLLRFWLKWGDKKEIKVAATKLVGVDPLLILDRFFGGFLSEGDDAEFQRTLFGIAPSLSDFKQIFDVAALNASVSALDSKKLNGREQRLLDMFRKLYAAHLETQAELQEKSLNTGAKERDAS